jgi:hypothetical protein
MHNAAGLVTVVPERCVNKAQLGPYRSGLVSSCMSPVSRLTLTVLLRKAEFYACHDRRDQQECTEEKGEDWCTHSGSDRNDPVWMWLPFEQYQFVNNQCKFHMRDNRPRPAIAFNSRLQRPCSDLLCSTQTLAPAAQHGMDRAARCQEELQTARCLSGTIAIARRQNGAI